MNSTTLIKRIFYFTLVVVTFSLWVISCGERSERRVKPPQDYSTGKEAPMAEDRSEVWIDSLHILPEDTIEMIPHPHDSVTEILTRPSSANLPGSRPERQRTAKGSAIVYCPLAMLRGIPSLLNATISKSELSAAIASFTKARKEQNPDLTLPQISANIKSDSIDLYERMGVILEFDTDAFKQISNDENPVKSFGNKNLLEWEWELMPLNTTPKTYVNFKFYYLNPNDNSREYILEKTFSIAVRVDPRKYLTKWEDFLFDDPKNTTTAILVPLCTFLGGFISGKKRKVLPENN